MAFEAVVLVKAEFCDACLYQRGTGVGARVLVINPPLQALGCDFVHIIAREHITCESSDSLLTRSSSPGGKSHFAYIGKPGILRLV